MKKFYITTPIYYVNAKPHLGHAYTTIVADVLARFQQLQGKKVFFATGTDEHGIKIENKARELNKTPQDFTDEISKTFIDTWKSLNISNSGFLRTTDKAHTEAVQNALVEMHKKGDIYLDKYEGLYCQGCEQFKNKKDLIDGKCLDHDTVPEEMSEESYMFKLSKYQKKLLELIEKDEFKIRPIERKNEVLSFYKNQGLNDISFSRKRVKWGIPLPWDKEYTAYVWTDAFLNYLTILGWDGVSKIPVDFWPADLQLMSKDILRVHATIWPAMLLSLDIPLPKEIFVHGFFTINGQKMSKSLGNVIDPNELVEKFGVDGARYLILSQFPFGQDGDINQDRFVEKYNADLANDLGNLARRVMVMIQKYKLQQRIQKSKVNLELTSKYLGNLEIYEALEIIWKKVRESNKYIDDSKPWNLAKKDPNKLLEVLQKLYLNLEVISRNIQPYIPDSAIKLQKSLEDFESINLFPKID